MRIEPDVEGPRGRPAGWGVSSGSVTSESLAPAAPVLQDIEARRVKAEVHRRLLDDDVAAPVTIGRFAVLGRVGQGGMGVVYSVYDEQLDRRVALKLIRGEANTELRRRLQREAQALAKLSHPNVVTVFEVGVHEQQVYLVMEYVRGPTLRLWISPERTSDEILATYVQAGRGLAAAHAAGLVHRDFKPDNAIVGEDNRVRVLDFGLARRHEEAEDLTVTGVSLSQPTALDTPLTVTGSTMGTPAYMAAEQFLGESIDHRSDQFSFCVALWEALCGERPFAGANRTDLIRAVTRGEVRPVPRQAKLPAWVAAMLVRGLAVSPADRWPSMDALLDAIDRRRKPRRMVPMVAASIAVAGVAAATLWVADRERPCSHARASIDAVMDPARVEVLGAQLRAIEVPYASTTADAVATGLAAWADAWVAGHTEACEATNVRREQSEALLDRRMQCLRAQTVELTAVLDGLANADAAVIEHAVDLVDGLPDVAHCADTEALSSAVPLPADEDARAEVEQVHAEFVALDVERELGRYAGLAPRMDELVRRAEAAAHAPTLADVLDQRASFLYVQREFEAARHMFERAHRVAIAGRNDEVARTAASMLCAVVGGGLGRYEEALAWSEEAMAWWHRGGEEPTALAQVLSQRAIAHNTAGKYEAARADGERALELIADGDTRRIAAVLQNLSITASGVRDRDQAIEYGRAAAELLEQRYGRGHPRVASIVMNRGAMLAKAERYDEAEAALGDALAMLEALHGDDGVALARPLVNLGEVARMRGDYAAAIGYTRRALALQERHLGPDSLDALQARYNLVHAFIGAARYAEARPEAERVLEARERTLGPDHLDVAAAAGLLSSAALYTGDVATAISAARRAVAISKAVVGDRHYVHAVALAHLAEALAAAREFEAARDASDRAMELLAADGSSLHLTSTAQARAALEAEAGDRAAERRWLETAAKHAESLAPGHRFREEIARRLAAAPK